MSVEVLRRLFEGKGKEFKALTKEINLMTINLRAAREGQHYSEGCLISCKDEYRDAQSEKDGPRAGYWARERNFYRAMYRHQLDRVMEIRKALYALHVKRGEVKAEILYLAGELDAAEGQAARQAD